MLGRLVSYVIAELAAGLGLLAVRAPLLGLTAFLCIHRVLSGMIFIAWSGQVSWHTLPLVVAGIVASTLVFIACGIVFFSLAFWLGKVETVARQLWELLITFSLYPEPLFGGMLRLALFTVLPAGFVGYLPARVVHAPSLLDVALLAIGAAAYLAGAVLIRSRSASLCVWKSV